MSESRRDLVKNVWPDKLLFGSIMLLVTSAIGLLHGLAGLVVDFRYGDKVPEILVAMPPAVTILLSAGAAVFAVMALRRVQTFWGILGSISGILALGLLGLGSFFSLVALVFLVLARQEGEDSTPATARLAPEDWPDKSLAASLLLFMAGALSLVWGAALVADIVSFGTFGAGLGLFSLAAGVLGLIASWRLYHQRGPTLGLVAAAANVLSLGGYGLGALLAAAAVVLILQAKGEREFTQKVPAVPARAPTLTRSTHRPKGP